MRPGGGPAGGEITACIETGAPECGRMDDAAWAIGYTFEGESEEHCRRQGGALEEAAACRRALHVRRRAVRFVEVEGIRAREGGKVRIVKVRLAIDRHR